VGFAEVEAKSPRIETITRDWKANRMTMALKGNYEYEGAKVQDLKG